MLPHISSCSQLLLKFTMASPDKPTPGEKPMLQNLPTEIIDLIMRQVLDHWQSDRDERGFASLPLSRLGALLRGRKSPTDNQLLSARACKTLFVSAVTQLPYATSVFTELHIYNTLDEIVLRFGPFLSKVVHVEFWLTIKVPGWNYGAWNFSGEATRKRIQFNLDVINLVARTAPRLKSMLTVVTGTATIEGQSRFVHIRNFPKNAEYNDDFFEMLIGIIAALSSLKLQWVRLTFCGGGEVKGTIDRRGYGTQEIATEMIKSGVVSNLTFRV